MAGKLDRPLKQKVKYDIKDHLITGKQVWWKKIIEWILTILGWAVLLSFVLYTIYGYIALKFNLYLPQFYVYNTEMLMELKKYLLVIFIGFLVATLILIIWKNYNSRRFGSRNRRQFRPAVTNDELAEFYRLDKSVIEEMQNSRYVELPTNIIAEDLGVGRKNATKSK
ncbi:MAG: poly-beta-1,6-N-acetyl-D-glucosamine biosynthesis protein PgaD [Clostridia bacterium]|nr:poly-beta-1,6-N-acetyl-D-glucosamine biosynthesis protein PgaD [Clostridia bacterium]